MISDPSQAGSEGLSKDIDPGDRHSGEGLASVGPALARTLDASARRQADALAARIWQDADPAPEPAANEPPAP